MKTLQLTIAFALALALGACGGSGSSSSGSSSGASGSSSGASSSSGGNGSSSGNTQPPPLVDNIAFEVPAAPTPTPHDVIPQGNNTYFVSPDGSNQDDGAEDRPFATLNHAVNQVAPGDVIVMRGGIYYHDDTIRINPSSNGTAGNPIVVFAYPGEEPILDFTPQPFVPNAVGVRLNASYWHLIGLTIRYAGHNGIRMDGSNNRLERLVAYENGDTGIHMAGTAANNLILNCDSYRNFNTCDRVGDSASCRVGNNADGFGVKFGQIGSGNVLYGNRAWENSDDGYDFWEAPSRIVLQNSWAFGNGDGSVFGSPSGFDGGGNGFKLGGNQIAGDHIVIGNLAFDNFGVSGNAKGFDHNNNRGTFLVAHNTAFNNGRNFTFPNPPLVADDEHRFYNNLSVDGAVQLPNFRTVQLGNSWQEGTADAGMFLSVDTALAKGPRQPDGSLPDIDLLRLAPGSFLVDGGVNIGLPYSGNAPDIGAYGYTQ